MTELDPLSVTAAFTGLGAVVLLAGKRAIIEFFKTKNEVATLQGADDMMRRYREEIERLEGIIAKMRDEIDELRGRVDQVHEDDIIHAHDIAEMSVVIETLCRDCEAGDSRLRMSLILERIRARMARRYTAAKAPPAAVTP